MQWWTFVAEFGGLPFPLAVRAAPDGFAFRSALVSNPFPLLACHHLDRRGCPKCAKGIKVSSSPPGTVSAQSEMVPLADRGTRSRGMIRPFPAHT